jgi:hypothetical protein
VEKTRASKRTLNRVRDYSCAIGRMRSHNLIRIGLAGSPKFDDLIGYRLLDVVVAVSDPKGDADLFERDT